MLRRLFIALVLIAATEYVYAFKTYDPNRVFSDPGFQQVQARLSSVEEHNKIQQQRIAELDQKLLDIQQHRIAELETLDIDQQKQLEIQQKEIAELEAHDIVHQQHLEIQQHRIAELETRAIAEQKRNEIQEQRMAELEPKVLGKDNILQDTLTAQNEEIVESQNEEHDEGPSTDINLIPDHGQQWEASNVMDALTDTPTTPGNRHRREASNNTNVLTRRQQANMANVAFTAILLHPMNDMGYDQNVVFDKVETNIGNAYNSYHGVFTAPVAGTYVFHVTIFSLRGTEEGWCKIAINAVNKVGVYAHGSSDRHDQGSQTLVVRLNQGDDVAVQNNHLYVGNVYGSSDLFTTFSGFLLRSDAEVAAIVG